MIANALPVGIQDNPRLEQWIGFDTPGRVRISTGKVELGQGILTAILQLAADELDVAPSRIDVRSGDTASTPAEGVTAGSMSIESSGASVRLVAAEVRMLLCAAAAHRLGCETRAVSVRDGAFLRDGMPTGLDYWQLAAALDLTRHATGTAPLKPAHERRLIGTNLQRADLAGKIMGAPGVFIHDMLPAGVLHARALRQPWLDAEPEMPDDHVVTAALASTAQILRIDRFIAVVAPNEAAAESAAERLASKLRWSGGQPPPPDHASAEHLRTRVAASTTTTRGEAGAAVVADARSLKRSYTKPFLAHASIGPSCALARFDGTALTVWSHTQGVVPLRAALAKALHLDVAAIQVIHAPGAGCYGHNGADDAACDAAIAARARPGETVRVLWSRADELAAAPLGTPMCVELETTLSPSGLPQTWTTAIWGGPHVRRPGANGGVNLLGAEALAGQPPRTIPQEMPEQAGGSGMRNAWLPYAVAQQTVHNHLIADLEPRTSAMRGLGAFANVFAIESFMDELADAAGVDPVSYRLQLLADPRARSVLEKAAAMANWQAGVRSGDGCGRGIAYSRYKNRAGYLALVVDVRVDADVRLERVWCAVDAGLVVNPDGVRNQVEGGILQAASWTLKEQVHFDGGRVASRSWDTYPILRFSDVPEIAIHLMERPDDPPLGVGEVAQGPTAAAIANAVAVALGVRLRDLPLTRERLVAAL